MKPVTMLSAVAVILSASVIGFAEDKVQTGAANPTVKSESGVKSTTDANKTEPAKTQPVVVEEIFTFGPTQYFHHSRELYKHQDMHAAALELDKAASMMDMAAKMSESTADTHKRLSATATDLRAVARNLRDGKKLPSLKVLESTVAKADIALAWYHYNAQGSKLTDVRGREAHIAGHHLLAAGHYMEAAAKWAGHPLGSEAIVTMKKLDEHGSKLVTENDYQIVAAEPTMKKFADELVKLGTEIENSSKIVKK